MFDDFDVISRSDLKEKMDRGDEFALVEVLSEEQFRSFHLPGAVNIPGNQLRKKAPTALPDKDREIVVYCSSPSCEASGRAAKLLSSMGYTNVKDYAGGKENWKEGGLPVEEGEPAATAD